MATVANSAFLQVVGPTDTDIHILDLGIWHGNQWPRLMKALVARSRGRPPSLRITKVGGGGSVGIGWGGLGSPCVFWFGGIARNMCMWACARGEKYVHEVCRVCGMG